MSLVTGSSFDLGQSAAAALGPWIAAGRRMLTGRPSTASSARSMSALSGPYVVAELWMVGRSSVTGTGNCGAVSSPRAMSK